MITVVLGSDVEVLRLLLSAGADLGTLDVHRQSTLLLAILSHSPTATQILLEHGVTDSDPQRLVNIATAQGDMVSDVKTILLYKHTSHNRRLYMPFLGAEQVELFCLLRN